MALDFLLKTRVKYVAIGVFCIFCLIIVLTTHDHSVEEEQLGLIQYRKNLVDQEADEMKRRRAVLRGREVQMEDPADFQVQFISGKELAHEVDNEHKSFQVHTVRITNMERNKVYVECEDPFSTFGKMINPGGGYEFRVTDLFAARHYWCAARYGSSEYLFRAYGEGAPRDNNQITLHKEGAFINGKNMRIEDSPMKYKLPKIPNAARQALLQQQRQEQHIPLEPGANFIPGEREVLLGPIPDRPEETKIEHHEKEGEEPNASS